MAEIDWGSLGQSQTIEQQRKTTRPMRKTRYENYFRFEAAILENGGNRLRQPRTLEIRRATSWAGLYNGNNTIRRHTIPSGEVGCYLTFIDKRIGPECPNCHFRGTKSVGSPPPDPLAGPRGRRV